MDFELLFGKNCWEEPTTFDGEQRRKERREVFVRIFEGKEW